ncbi:MAG: DUF4179 domain-containing protein [Peptostreptococcaceae bacterium]
MKDNFKLLNNVDIDLNKYEDLSIDKDKLKQNMRKQIKTKSKFNKSVAVAASICAVGVGLFGAGIINPSIADSIPIVKDIFEELNCKLNLGYIDYNDIQQVGASITSNGTTITIEEAISDGSNIFITYSIKSNKKIPRDIIPEEYQSDDYDENKGDLMLYGNVRSRTKDLYVNQSLNVDGYFKDDYNFIGMEMYEIRTKDSEIPEFVNFEINIESIGSVMTEYEDMLKGDWTFNLNIDTKSSIKTIDINQSKDGFKLNNISISPYSIVANIEFPKSFIATKEEENENIEKRIRIDANEAKDVYWHSITSDGVDHGIEYGYMSSNDNAIRVRPSVMINNPEIKGTLETLRISFDNVKDGNDRKKVIFDIDLNNFK